MINEILLVVEVAVVFGMLLLSKKMFGKEGLLAWIAIASIVANIQVAKSIDLLGISSAHGNVLFASTFLATNMLTECYDKKVAQKGVYIGVFATVAYMVNMQLCLWFKPNDIDIAQTAMSSLFSISLRVCFASLIMYFLANFFNVQIYARLMKRFKEKHLWLRNNVSTIVCNCLENFGFAFLSFYGIYPVGDIVMIAATGCVIEMLLSVLSTPFLYIGKKMKEGILNERDKERKF